VSEEAIWIYRIRDEISYSVHGHGRHLMLVHGFAEDSRIWDPLVPTLKQKYQLIIPDLPGSGRSTSIKGQVELTEYASALNTILENERIEKITIIGHSMGGYITLAFTELFPSKIDRLGLFHSSAFADDAAKKETREKGIRFVRSNGALAFLKTSIPGLFYDQAISAEHISLLTERAASFSDDTLVQYYRAMISRPDRTGILKNFERPVLIIAGKHDNAVPLEASLKQAHIAPATEFHILKKTAHMGMLEESIESEKILAVFLENSQSML